MCAVKTLKEVPESFPVNGNPAQQMAWLNRLSRRILRYCWLGPLPEDVEAAAKAYDNPTRVTNADTLGYCICGEGELMRNSYHKSLLLSCWNSSTMLRILRGFHWRKLFLKCCLRNGSNFLSPLNPRPNRFIERVFQWHETLLPINFMTDILICNRGLICELISYTL